MTVQEEQIELMNRCSRYIRLYEEKFAGKRDLFVDRQYQEVRELRGLLETNNEFTVNDTTLLWASLIKIEGVERVYTLPTSEYIDEIEKGKEGEW